MYHSLYSLPLCTVIGACQSPLRCGNYCCDDGWCNHASDGCSMCINNECQSPLRCGNYCWDDGWCNRASDGCSMCIDNACQPIPIQKLPFEENLQLVPQPELPAYWRSNNMKGDSDIMWAVDVDGNEHYFYIPNSASVTNIALVSPRIAIPSSRAILTLQHLFQFNVNDEFGKPFFDGGIAEVSINQMVYENIEKVGSFISGSYYGIIYGWENNLSDQNGFVEKSNGKITSAIKLSPDLKDSVIQLCFRIGTDVSGGDLGWNISSISVAVPRCGGSCNGGCQDATDGCTACSK
jgi:hypothetical protein